MKHRRLIMIKKTLFFLALFLLSFFYHMHIYDKQVSVLQPFWGKTIEVSAHIASLPVRHRSMVQVDAILNLKDHPKVHLSCYRSCPEFKPGQYWQIKAKIKPPLGHQNPGSSDRSNYYRFHEVAGLASIHSAKFLNKTDGFALVRWRYKVDRHILSVPGLRAAPVMLALTDGIKSQVSRETKSWFIATGTSHLMAISGLHLGLLALLIWSALKGLRRIMPVRVMQAMTLPIMAWTTLLLTGAYVLFTGASISTKRAWIMLFFYMLKYIFSIEMSFWRSWILACCAVLLLWPLSLYSPGFWLSFFAVAALGIAIATTPTSISSVRKTLTMQAKLTLLLSPLVLFIFHQVTLISLPVNLLAIPYISLWMPIGLLGMLLGGLALQVADQALSWFLHGLSWVSQFAHWIYLPHLSLFGLITLTLSFIIILLPRPFPARYLIIFLFLPALPLNSHPISIGEVAFTVFDVGQGLSVLVRTAHHNLLYDTGPRFGHYDLVTPVIIPAFRFYNLNQLDMVMVSHGDMDHSGGVQTLSKLWPVQSWISGEPKRIQGAHAQLCQAGQAWMWDGVTFETLAPEQHHKHHNDNSCVLRVQGIGGAILLPGDISRAQANRIARANPHMHSEILIAPHHGSHGSLSPHFLSGVSPQWVIFATGRYNRFHFPSIKSQAFYCQGEKNCFNTAWGAVEGRITRKGVKILTHVLE